MIIAFILVSLVLILLIVEKWYINVQVNKIPIRILVNGTRGKSTSVKYLAALLRSNDYKVLSKITGIIPTVFYEDDDSEVIKRRGGARVTEQFGIINKAARKNVDAIVLECMSINPELQKLESTILKPHIYVITNIREDHLEDLGSTPEEWAESICNAIPENCTVITTETDQLDIIKRYAAERNSKVVTINEILLNEQSTFESVHPDNLKIVRMCAEEINLKIDGFYDRLKLIEQEKSLISIKHGHHKISFVNAFAANDVPSATKIYYDTLDEQMTRYIVFNSRGDRPYRTTGFMEWLSKAKVEKYFLAGTNSGLARRILKRNGVEENKIIRLNEKRCENFESVLSEYIDNDSLIFGFGNIKGSGIKIINRLNEME